MANYVKFMRGTKAAYDALITKNADTLYFITDNENKTSLYLGDTIVSNSANNLSPAAQDFLNNLPSSDDPTLSDGDLQVYVIEETEVDKVDPETGEIIIDPDTGDPIKETITEGHWETKSINDLIPIFEGGNAGLVPQAPTQNANNKYLNGEGQWIELNETIIQEVISTIVGEGQLDENFDTLKEISDWILNHPAGVAEINSRLTNIENALGFEYEEVPVQAKDEESEDGLAWEKDEQGNYVFDENNEKIPVYETQPVQAKDEESEDGLAWEKDEQGNYIFDENNEKIPIYETEEIEVPVQKVDPETGELLFDENNNPIYETEIIGLVDPETGEPIINEQTGEQETEERIVTETQTVIVQEVITERVLKENSVDNFIHFQTVVGNLSSLLGYSETPEPHLLTIDNFVSTVGNLNDLLLKQEETQTDEGNPNSLVEAINILDDRTRWQELTI